MTKIPTLIPPVKPSKQQMVAETVECLDRGLHKMTSEYGRQQLRDALRRAIQKGTLSRMQVIKAADAGFAEADRALREEWIEMEERHEPIPDTLKDYMKRRAADDFSPKKRPRGNDLLDDFPRNIAACVLVDFVRIYFRQTRRMAFIIVSEAVGKRHFNLSPRRVENIYNELGGLAARLAKLIPSEA